MPRDHLDDGKAVRFRAKEVHWQNLGACGGMEILPKHVWEGRDFNKINFEFPVVSGPYRIKELKEGFYLVLEKRHDWWRSGWKNQQNLNNFDEIKCVFFEEQDNAFEAFLKGEIDVFHVYTASQWHKIEERVSAVRQNWIVKQSIYNYSPVGFQGFAMNMRRPPFDDVRVRKALAHLVDRETMNTTMMYSQYFMHRSFWEDLYDDYVTAMTETVNAAVKLGVKQVVAVSGNERHDVERYTCHHNVVKALTRVAPIAEEAGVTIVLEPLNILVDHMGYYLVTSKEGFDMLFELAKELISKLPQNNLSPVPMYEFDEPSFVGADNAEDAVKSVFDADSAVELYPEYGKASYTALATLGGATVGVVATNKTDDKLTSADCSKIARFVRFCDAFAGGLYGVRL